MLRAAGNSIHAEVYLEFVPAAWGNVHVEDVASMQVLGTCMIFEHSAAARNVLGVEWGKLCAVCLGNVASGCGPQLCSVAVCLSKVQ